VIGAINASRSPAASARARLRRLDLLERGALCRYAWRVGILPGWGLSQKLSRTIGIYRAKDVADRQFLERCAGGRMGLANRGEFWGRYTYLSCRARRRNIHRAYPAADRANSDKKLLAHWHDRQRAVWIEGCRALTAGSCSSFVCMSGPLPMTRAGVESMTLRAVVEHRVVFVFHCQSCLRRCSSTRSRSSTIRTGPRSYLRERARCSNCKRRKVEILLRRPNAVHRRDGWIPYAPADPMRDEIILPPQGGFVRASANSDKSFGTIGAIGSGRWNGVCDQIRTGT